MTVRLLILIRCANTSLPNENYQVNYPLKGDFLVDETYLLEVGGASKSNKQIIGIENAFIVADNFDFAIGNKIPIWLFGLLY